MSMFTAFNISASGMTAQQLRTDVISENIANADTTRTSDGTPYVRKAVVFTEKTMTGTALGKSAYGSYGTGAYSTFSDALRLANGGVVGSGVKVTSVYEDTSTDMERVYDPSHPDADENGYVTYPNVNVVQEMTDLIDASRSYYILYVHNKDIVNLLFYYHLYLPYQLHLQQQIYGLHPF